MNKVVLMGRLTKEPMITTAGEHTIARYTLAVNRRRAKDADGDQADFINCVAFDKRAEFAQKYLHKGTKMLLLGHIQTGSYQKQDGTKVYTTDVVAEEQEFAESKKDEQASASNGTAMGTNDFMQIPDGMEAELPFN